MEIINRRLFLVKYGALFSVLPNMLAAEQVGNICGFPVANDRKLAFVDRPPMGFRNLRIVSIEKHNSGSVFRISIHKPKNSEYFFSTDNGRSWQPDSSEMNYCGNLNKYPNYEHVASNNARTLFWQNSNIFKIVVSEDKGKSWKTIEIPSNIETRIGGIKVASVSPHDDNRIYVFIRYSTGRIEADYGIYQVDSRAKTVIKIADNISYMIESRANPKTVIGTTSFSRENVTYTEIIVSKDGGLTWNKAKEDIVPNYYYIGENTASLIRQSPSDRFRNLPRPIEQIESDPDDPDTFYVVTWSGVFVTNNLGESFRILPIAHEYLHGVDEIAVNPVDGRHIFAAVKATDLYHSDDRGCTWKKLELPTIS